MNQEMKDALAFIEERFDRVAKRERAIGRKMCALERRVEALERL